MSQFNLGRLLLGSIQGCVLLSLLMVGILPRLTSTLSNRRISDSLRKSTHWSISLRLQTDPLRYVLFLTNAAICQHGVSRTSDVRNERPLVSSILRISPG